MRQTIVSVLSVVACAGSSLAQSAPGSVLDRSPNLSGGWAGNRGVLQFNFTHRFRILDSPGKQLSNIPSFLLAYRAAPPLMIGVNYASSSFIVQNFPNEFELFGRGSLLAAGRGAPVDLTVQLGYHQAARSADADVTLARVAGPLRLFGSARFLSNGYASDTARYAVGGGAVLRLGRHVALAGDVTSLLDRRPGEDVAWGAALQLAIPYTPHTLSLQVTNVTTATLQGSALGTDIVRGGFEFTIPITLARYGGGGGRRGEAAANRGGGEGAATGAVQIQGMAFPARVAIPAGATLEWTNNDAVAHTVTADDGSWDSGLIAPGATWRRTFAQAGDYAYHCTPHPFMRGVVVVR